MQHSDTHFPLYVNSISGAADQVRQAGYRFEKHLHSSIEVYLIRSGKCVMDIGDQSVSCIPGDFVMILPYVVHSFCVPENEECSFYHIHFSPKLFSRIALTPDAKNPINLIHSLLFCCRFFHRQAASDEIRKLVASVVNLYDPANSLLLSADINVLLLQLLIRVCRCYNEVEILRSQSKSPGQYISFTLNYIEENYTNKILIQDISSRLHISTRYLGKIFSHYMNVSLGNYINIYRINKAVELMEDATLSLTDIAGRIGLKDSQHFSKLFFSVIGMPPSRYRKQFLQSEGGSKL